MANLPEPGQVLYGFTAVSRAAIKSISASALELYHSFSGARVLCIQNDDRERCFSIIYRTPQLDETDACHMAEHLVLSSCRKYRSRDVFFDMDSKSYSTFMNGITDTSYTCYPVCSLSENQLIRLMDVILCCMEEPDALTEPHFFEREVLRFELERPDGPLAMAGTVFGEDWAHLTDLEENADSHTARTLYPGSLAANLPGRAHLHYEDISRERVMEVIRSFYRYSNCLIVLYGDMDYAAALRFLDREHLSKALPYRKEELISLFREPVIPGFRESEEESPAYEGGRISQASVIDYGIDLSHCSNEELILWDLFAELLDNSTSPLHRIAREEGLNHVIQVYLDTLLIHPVLKFRLFNGDRTLKGPFLSAVRRALSEIQSFGVPKELYRASVRENRMTDSLAREGVHLGCHAAEEIGRYWSLTGRTDYFPLYERAFETFAGDKTQEAVRRMAGEALSAAASALTVTVPVPGLAERLEAQKDNFLKRKKASLSEAEAAALFKAHQGFLAWNEREESCRSFLISPGELPAPRRPEPFFVKKREGITGYFSPVPGSRAGSFQIYFDLGFLSREELPLLALYQLLLTELDTPSLTSSEQKLKEQELLHDCTFDEAFPEPEAGENSHPALAVSWYGFPEEFSQGLELLLEIMEHADYGDTAAIIRALEKYLPDYDLSQGENAASLSYALAESAIRMDARFRAAANSQEVYYFLKDVLRRLKEGPGSEEAGKELAERLQSIARAVVTKSRMNVLAAASGEALPAVEQAAFSRLGKLQESPKERRRPGRQKSPRPDGPEYFQTGRQGGLPPNRPSGSPADAYADSRPGRPDAVGRTDALLFPAPMRAAVSLDASSQEIRLMGDFSRREDFKGRYLPFLMALSDRYLKPALRYQGGAYDCGADFSLPNGYFSLWCTADPGLRDTVRVFQDAGNALRRLDIGKEELDGYILSAYAQAQPLSGPLNARMRLMRRELSGIQAERIHRLLTDIPHASPDCKEEAAAMIQELIDCGSLAAAGSRRAVSEAANLFEQTYHLHS